jgi:hypothetical protein
VREYRWPSVALKGHDAEMPDVCPNCMGRATERVLTSYRSKVLGVFPGFDTTYKATVLYCRTCADSARKGLRTDTAMDVLAQLVVALSMAAVAVIVAFDGPDRTRYGFLVIGVLLLLTTLMVAHVALRKPEPGQAVWGAAVYYTGAGLLRKFIGFESGQILFRAARKAWLAELVRRNPARVDDATYLAATGESRPLRG